jgi:hypothetical protein
MRNEVAAERVAQMAQKFAASAVKVAACCTILRLFPPFWEIFFSKRRRSVERRQEPVLKFGVVLREFKVPSSSAKGYGGQGFEVQSW